MYQVHVYRSHLFNKEGLYTSIQNVHLNIYSFIFYFLFFFCYQEKVREQTKEGVYILVGLKQERKKKTPPGPVSGSCENSSKYRFIE